MIVDCTILKNNIDLSELRVDLFGNKIDKFIFFVPEGYSEQLANKLQPYNQEIDIYEMDKFGDLDEITKVIIDMNFSYEDIVFLSQENEFFDWNQMEDIKSRLFFSPVIIYHKKFIDNSITIDFVRQKGTLVFLNHQLKSNKSLLSQLEEEKKQEFYKNYLPVESGFLS